MEQSHSTLRGILLTLLVLPVLCGPLLAQVDISAQLVGSVTDPSGAVLRNAKLTARDQLTAVQTTVTSDAMGNFKFSSLAPGTYTVTCTATGFQTFITSDIALQAGQIITLPIKLSVGSPTQRIEVSGAATMVNTQTATLQTTVNERIIQALPVYGRDPSLALQSLMPGVNTTADPHAYQYNGVVGTTNNFHLDGSDFNSYFNGYQIVGPTQNGQPYPSVENLAEFNVITNNAPASYGRGAGGQIEAVIKSGTNTFHGQGWAYFQNSAWNANSWSNNWQGIRKDHFVQQWYGGNLGGPVIIPHLYDGTNKTFFFISFQRTSTSSTSTAVGQTITNAERHGDFTNSPDGIPIINGVPTPIIPDSDFSTLGKFIETHTDVIPVPTSGTDTYTWHPSDEETIKQLAVKIDHNFGEKNRIFGSLWFTRDRPAFNDMYYIFSGAAWTGQYPNPKATFYMQLYNTSWTINDTYTISSKMVNNIIVGVHHLDEGVYNTYKASDALFNNADLGTGFVPDFNAAEVQNIAFPRAMGQGAWNGYENPLVQDSYEVADNFTVIRGRHTIETGVQVEHFRQHFFGNWDAGLSFSDSNKIYGGTGNGVADMLLGLAPNYSQTSDPIENLYYPDVEAYAQDTFKISKSVTLLYGVRWEPFYGVHTPTNSISTFVAGRKSTEFPTAPVGLVVPGDRGIPPNLVGNKWTDFGPRASVAWDIFGNGKAALRAGYALMSTFQTMQSFNSYSTSAPFGISYKPTPQGLNLANPYAQYGSVPFPWQVPTPGAPRNASIVFPNNLNTLSIGQSYNNGAVHEFNFTMQIEPVRSYMFSFGYVGTRGTHLNESHDINYPRFVPGASTNNFANVQSRRPFGPAFQSINQFGSDFNSRYNSLQVTFNKRYSYGLTFLGNYTLSSLEQQYNGARNWADPSLDYYGPGVSHTFTIGFTYALPIPTGKARLAKTFIGGWAIGGDVSAHSGVYGSIGSYDCGTFNFQSAGCYANFTGGIPYSNSERAPLRDATGRQIGVKWLDPSKFVDADQSLVNGVVTTSSQVGQRLFLGNAIVGTYKGPSAYTFNLSLSKDFALTERVKLNYRIEALNTFNHTNLNMPAFTTVQPDMSTFGAITSAADPRHLQMSGHIIF